MNLVAVGGSGCHGELAIGLVEEVFGALGVAVHVELVGALGVGDAGGGAGDELLGGGEVGMTAGADVVDGTLGYTDCRAYDAEGEAGAENEIAKLH